MKARRHHKILSMLRANRVESQDMLQALLKEDGIEVNQATLSRDLHALGVVKEPCADGGFQYRQAEAPQMTAIALTNLRAFVNDMVSSGNILVIKTRVGGAQPVGLALDQLGIQGIIGTVAGDDTVMAIIAENATGQQVAEAIWETIDTKGNDT